MSCNRQCFDKEDEWYGHDDCSTCSGRDDGSTTEEKMKDRPTGKEG